ncbi:MAG TPA: NAD(P)H-dependent glycerol-3-phosphate dehydrogenase, partial [Candidatus Poseidoniales archaeon]|nr:NAD(P)H-dependent glycerol-3-phosphate dehydrogenase [Candidatus Poseidoniales archaeon]
TKIGILGLGNWGTALANIWAKDGHSVIGWTVETEVYESMVLNNVNEKYLPDVKLPGVDATLDIGEVCDVSELLILAIPSGVILSVVDQLLPHLRPSHVLVDLAKGIAPEEEGDSGLISAAIEKRLNGAGLTNPVVVLTGPTIAPEVARGVLTNALVAAHDRSVAERVASRLSTDTLILKAADDPVGAELWGAFKNTVALACGIVDGLRDGIGGDNLKAALVPIGFAEGRKLLILLGAEEETSLGPAGLGDLYVTSTSPRSRNRTLGQKLGEGKSLKEGLAEMHMVAEGVRAARMFRKRASQVGCPAPFIESLNILLDGDITAEECVRRMVEQSL